VRLKFALERSVPWVAIATANPDGLRNQAAKNAEDDLKFIQEALAPAKDEGKVLCKLCRQPKDECNRWSDHPYEPEEKP
jgi:hypothetical protein